VIVELQEQLLAQERELDSREGTIIAWEESLMAFACALGEASAEHDASHAHADAIRLDYYALVSASSSWSGWLNTLSWSLEEPTTLLCL
jgi:hypothetical protein